jgi:hypothetical protein
MMGERRTIAAFEHVSGRVWRWIGVGSSSIIPVGEPGTTLFVRGFVWRLYWDDGRHSKKLREGHR